MHPRDVAGLVSAADPQLSPDGTQIAFVVARVDAAKNAYRSSVWLAAVDGATPARQLTAGDQRDGNPRWAPDGRALAFTSSRGEPGKGPVTLHVLPMTGPGELRTLCTRNEGIGDLAWSPDGTALAFTSRVRDARYDADDPKAQAPRRIGRFFSRLNGEGWIVDRPTHVFVVPADGSGEPEDRTPGEFSHSGASWLPDGSGVVTAAARHETWDLDLAGDLYLVPVTGDDEPERLTATDRTWSMPSVAPDGTALVAITEDHVIVPSNPRLTRLGLDGGRATTVLAAAIDRSAAPFPGVRPSIWLADGSAVFSIEDRGNVHVYRVPVTADGSGEPTLLVGGERKVLGYDATADGRTIAFVATTHTQLSELYVQVDGRERRLSGLGDGFTARVGARPAEAFTAVTPDGTEVDAWIMLPHDFDPEKRYPALLNIHGGPMTQYGASFFDEFQVQARAGYVVLFSNPRGSSGREESWIRAIRGRLCPTAPGSGWGGVDADDVLAVVDTAVERFAFIDPDRLGVLGGSYGGYMTSWLIGHDHRFKAACSERAVNNLRTMEWTSDIATVFRTEMGVSHLDAPDEYDRMSPITYVREIRTPVLILHSEDDLRCPISQAEELFVALRLLGKEVEFVRFPGESHELTRSGSPTHRRQRFELLLEFFAKHLHPEGATTA